MGEYTTWDEFDEYIGISNNTVNGSQFNFPGTWVWNLSESEGGFLTQIDGKNYWIATATHQNSLAAGAETIPSLNQIYLVSKATQDIADKFDGNDNGSYDILVFTQAVQANGFDSADAAFAAAFGGPVTASNCPAFTAPATNP